MHKQLEKYLNAIAHNLGPLPKARQEEELREIQAHLLSAIAVYQEAGQSEEKAVQMAIGQFGSTQTVAKDVVSAWRREVWKRWRNAPLEVLLFGVFSVIVTLSSFWLTFAGPELWREAIYPYIGGSSLAIPYMFSLFFTCAKIFASDNDPKAMLGPILELFLYAVFGAKQYMWACHLPNPHSSYFDPNPWQPVWTVAFPLAWAIVLGVCPIIRGRNTRRTAD